MLHITYNVDSATDLLSSGHILWNVFSMLLNKAAKLRLITVGPIPLALNGEYVHLLQPLSLLEGMELFVDTAQRYAPELALSQENAALISKIVKKLRFLPLALEVVAAQTAVLSLSDIYRKLSVSIDLAASLGAKSEEMALLGTLGSLGHTGA